MITTSTCSYPTFTISGNLNIFSSGSLIASQNITGGVGAGLSAGSSGSGGTYGGQGGASASLAVSTSVYGTAWLNSTTSALLCGSAGGAGLLAGGAGGGVINVVLTGNTSVARIDGSVLANGGDAAGYGGGGGRAQLHQSEKCMYANRH